MQNTTRRHMLKTSALLGTGFFFLPSGVLTRGQSPNEKLNVACIGLGNQGTFQVSNLGRMKNEVNLVALCDVDDVKAGKAYENNPGAKKYYDFRQMFDEMEDSIDAVAVSTPDHTHYHPVIRALRSGKHVYCEKPLAHSVQEIRNITETAAAKKLATQLGCQRHAFPNMHRVTELVQSGAIGEITEVHSWIGGQHRGMPEKPTEFIDPPSTLKWDLWIGPCPNDWKYSLSKATNGKIEPTLVPYNWRFWWDFGTGETGNWSCHILDIPYSALNLKYPIKVSASGPEVDPDRTPREMHIVYDYPASEKFPAVKLYWSHSDNPPCLDKFGISKRMKNVEGKNIDPNTLFVGTKGKLLTGFDRHMLFLDEKSSGFERPEPFVPDSPGFHREWINACKGGEPATCNFEYSGPMAETAILGNAAFRAGHKTFDWDAATLTAKNCPEVQQLIKPVFRRGWEW